MAVIVKLDDYRTVPAQLAVAHIRANPWLSEEDRALIRRIFVKLPWPWPAVADLTSAAQAAKPCSTTTIPVQILGAK
jgi:hypothetical protein